MDEKFLNPPAEYRIHQIIHDWGNDYHSKLKELKEYGFGGVVTNVPWDEDYLLSTEKFGKLDKVIDDAGKMGLRAWLYDEKGYPSGAAGGLVLEGYPEYEARGIFQIDIKGIGKMQMEIPLPEEGIRFVHAVMYPVLNGSTDFSGGIDIDFTETIVTVCGIDGEWILCAYVEKIAFQGTHAQNNGWEPRHYPNLLDRDAVRRFIKVAYEPYYKNLSSFEKNIHAIFTDEPSLMAAYQNTETEFKYAVIPWEKRLPEMFFKHHGYNLFPHLHSLFEGMTEEDKTVRVNFYKTISEMLAESYFGQIAEWCCSHRVNASGHALLEESMVYHVAYYGSLMRVIREMQFPGVDMLTTRPHTYLYDNFGYFMAAKYVSSAARAVGKKQVMAEICPVIFSPDGNFEIDKEASLDDMVGTANLLYFNGVTHVNSYYNIGEHRQEEYKKYCEYVGRLGVMLQDAVHVPSAGMMQL